MTARVLDIGPDEYHLRPGLSSSTATTIVSRSPLHAWLKHPSYGGKGKDPTKEMDTGTIIHTLVLGAGKRFEVLDAKFKDYKTNAAKDARDAARAEGKVPILAEKFVEAGVAAKAILEQFAARGITLDGQSEVAVEWEEPTPHGSLLCRGMFDHVWLDRGVILDLKVTHDANPSSVERSAENFGYAIQAHAYQRALSLLRPELAGRTEFLFAFCEPEEPYAMNVCRPDGTFRELGERRWKRAVDEWARCIAENEWPAYGSAVNWITPPAWALAKEGY